MSCPELLLWPDSATTSVSTSARTPGSVTLPVADAAYFEFLSAIQHLGKPDYVVEPGWTQTPRLIEVGSTRILTNVIQLGDPTDGLRALTAQLRRGIVPPASLRISNLANRVLGQPPQDGAQIDNWARGLAEDVADADD
jgi:hypothetical protein